MKIIFFGTPGFAKGVLETIIDAGVEVAAVVTAPDKPAGRGKKIQSSEVKIFADEKKLLVFQPEKLKSPEFIEELTLLNADIFVVVAFRMLPEQIWQMPKLGTFNLHASLLPQYRGAAPINWAIINGEAESGVTTFFIQKEIDTGNIIFQEKIAIEDGWDAGILHDKLLAIGSHLVVKTIRAIEVGNVVTIVQNKIDPNTLKVAPKIFKENCKIDFEKSGLSIYRLCKGMSPFPGAWCNLEEVNGKNYLFKIFDLKFVSQIDPSKKTGDIESDGKSFFRVYTYDGFLELLSIQLEGKKRMLVEEFLRGYQFNKNIRLN